jgi:hypothetical protein
MHIHSKYSFLDVTRLSPPAFRKPSIKKEDLKNGLLKHFMKVAGITKVEQ